MDNQDDLTPIQIKLKRLDKILGVFLFVWTVFSVVVMIFAWRNT